MAVIHLTLCPLMSDVFYSEAEHKVTPSAGSRHDPPYKSALQLTGLATGYDM